jgi:uncharacterized protein
MGLAERSARHLANRVRTDDECQIIASRHASKILPCKSVWRGEEKLANRRRCQWSPEELIRIGVTKPMDFEPPAVAKSEAASATMPVPLAARARRTASTRLGNIAFLQSLGGKGSVQLVHGALCVVDSPSMSQQVAGATVQSISVSSLEGATFLLLALSVAALWSNRRIWVSALVLSFALGYAGGVLSGFAALWVALFAAACEVYGWSRSLSRAPARYAMRTAGLVGMVALGIGLALHVFPGFHNPLVVSNVVLTPAAAPYDLRLSFDKTAAGVLVLGLCYRGLIRKRTELTAALQRATLPIVVTIAALVSLSLLLHYVQWAPKWTSQFWLWAADNLIATCVSEEAFFRGFIQKEVAGALRFARYGGSIAVATSAILFGLAHFAGGPTYVAVAAVAGLGYAVVFRRTGRVEMSILAHFLVNATHFTLFTFPYALR